MARTTDGRRTPHLPSRSPRSAGRVRQLQPFHRARPTSIRVMADRFLMEGRNSCRSTVQRMEVVAPSWRDVRERGAASADPKGATPSSRVLRCSAPPSEPSPRQPCVRQPEGHQLWRGGPEYSGRSAQGRRPDRCATALGTPRPAPVERSGHPSRPGRRQRPGPALRALSPPRRSADRSTAPRPLRGPCRTGRVVARSDSWCVLPSSCRLPFCAGKRAAHPWAVERMTRSLTSMSAGWAMA